MFQESKGVPRKSEFVLRKLSTHIALWLIHFRRLEHDNVLVGRGGLAWIKMGTVLNLMLKFILSTLLFLWLRVVINHIVFFIY